MFFISYDKKSAIIKPIADLKGNKIIFSFPNFKYEKDPKINKEPVSLTTKPISFEDYKEKFDAVKIVI